MQEQSGNTNTNLISRRFLEIVFSNIFLFTTFILLEFNSSWLFMFSLLQIFISITTFFWSSFLASWKKTLLFMKIPSILFLIPFTLSVAAVPILMVIEANKSFSWQLILGLVLLYVSIFQTAIEQFRARTIEIGRPFVLGFFIGISDVFVGRLVTNPIIIPFLFVSFKTTLELVITHIHKEKIHTTHIV